MDDGSVLIVALVVIAAGLFAGVFEHSTNAKICAQGKPIVIGEKVYRCVEIPREGGK